MGLRLVRFPSPSTLFINQTDKDGNKFIERHEELLNRGLPNCHPIIAITGLREELDQLHSEKINFGNTNTVKYDTRLNQNNEYDILHHVVLSESNAYNDPSKNEYVAISYPGHTYDECKAKAEEMGLVLAMPKTALEWSNAFATVVDLADQRFYIGSVKRNQVIHVDNGNVTYAGNYQWLDETNIDLAYVSNSYTSFNAYNRDINTGVALSYYSGSLTTDWIFADTLLDGFIGERTYQSTVTLDEDTKQPYTVNYPNTLVKLADGLYAPDYKTYIDQVLAIANAKQAAISVGTTDTISMGLSSNRITANARISSRIKNVLQAYSDGLYVKEFKLNILDTTSVYQKTSIGDGLKDVFDTGTFISLQNHRGASTTGTSSIYDVDGKRIGGVTKSPYYPHQNLKVEQKNGTYWYYSSTRGSFVQHTNVQAAAIGIVAKPTFTNYVHRCILTSSDSDNDMNGIIIAYWESADEEECHTLTLILSPSMNNAEVGIGGTNYAVVYDFNMPTSRGGHQILASCGNTAAGHWAPYANGGWYAKWGNRNYTHPDTYQTYTYTADSAKTQHYIGVYAEKTESIIRCKITDWKTSQAAASSGYINASTIEIDLDNYSWGWMFSGRTRYGYFNRSQAESYWILQEISGSDEIGLHVRLSPDNGNILQIKDNGLFVPSPDNWSGTITSLQNTVNNHTSQITSLQNTVNSHTTTLNSIQNTLENHNTRITANTNDITKLKTYSNNVFKNTNSIYYSQEVLDASLNKTSIAHHIRLKDHKRKGFTFIRYVGDFYSAIADAESKGYRLAMPKNADEWNEIVKVRASFSWGSSWDWFYLGCHFVNDRWEWLDGTPATYIKWRSGFPNNPYYNDVMAIYSGDSACNAHNCYYRKTGALGPDPCGYFAEYDIYDPIEEYDSDTTKNYIQQYPNALILTETGLYAPDYGEVVQNALDEARSLKYNFKDTYSTSINKNGQDVSIDVKISNKIGNMLSLQEDGLYIKVPEEIESYDELIQQVLSLDERVSLIEEDYVEYEFYDQTFTEQDIIERAIEDDSKWQNWNFMDSDDTIEETDVLSAIEEDSNWGN